MVMTLNNTGREKNSDVSKNIDWQSLCWQCWLSYDDEVVLCFKRHWCTWQYGQLVCQGCCSGWQDIFQIITNTFIPAAEVSVISHTWYFLTSFKLGQSIHWVISSWSAIIMSLVHRIREIRKLVTGHHFKYWDGKTSIIKVSLERPNARSCFWLSMLDVCVLYWVVTG